MQTINLQFNAGHDFENFNRFEDFIVTSVRQGIMQAVRRYLRILDEELSCQFELEHHEYRSNGQVFRTIKFYFGTIRLSRRRYSCKGQKDVYPLDSFLPLGMLSEKIAGFGIDLSTEIPYARSSRLLEKLLGVRISGKGLWHLVQRKGLPARKTWSGGEERAVHEAERNRIFEEARDSYPQDWQRDNTSTLPVYLELDGTMVASRESGEERFEIKSGIMYRDIQQIGKRRNRLMDKVVYTAAESSAVFSEQFYAFCRKYGLPNRAEMIFISDGAGWLRNSAGYVFPQAEK